MHTHKHIKNTSHVEQLLLKTKWILAEKPFNNHGCRETATDSGGKGKEAIKLGFLLLGGGTEWESIT